MENKAVEFDWSRLGDVETGRQKLGSEMPVIVYRLMQYTIMDELYESLEKRDAEDLVRRAGYRAGHALAKNTLDLNADFNTFTRQLSQILKDYKIGIIKIEKADLNTMELTLTVDEDLDCSGLPVYDETVCYYDEGFIAGILEAYTKIAFVVKEIDCWATGDRTCRFNARPEK